MLVYRTGSDTAIMVLHEIYGINRHIASVCRQYERQGYDVYCPNLLNLDRPFSYSEQEQAYSHFIAGGGFAVSAQVKQFMKEIRPCYQKIILAGFSIGATLAWILSETGLCDGMIACYGSRIRDYPEITPACPVLCIFAAQETAFSPAVLADSWQDKPGITAVILTGRHGFCDPFSDNYHAASANEAGRLTQLFLATIDYPPSRSRNA